MARIQVVAVVHNFKHWEMWLQEEVILLPCSSHPCFKRVNYDSSAWQSFGRGHLCINGRREVVAVVPWKQGTLSVRSVLVQCRWSFTSLHGLCWGKLVCLGYYSIHTVGVHLCATLTRTIRADNWGPRQNTWIAAAAAKQGNLQGGAPVATRWEQQVMPNNFSAPFFNVWNINIYQKGGRRQQIFELFAPPSICPDKTLSCIALFTMPRNFYLPASFSKKYKCSILNQLHTNHVIGIQLAVLGEISKQGSLQGIYCYC